eukprot:scaffold375856_cov38-Prasinocladus_malaysianus.AAC.1
MAPNVTSGSQAGSGDSGMGSDIRVPLLDSREDNNAPEYRGSDDGSWSSSFSSPQLAKLTDSIRKCLSKRRNSSSLLDTPDTEIDEAGKRDFDASLLPFTDAEVISYSMGIGLFCGVFTAAFIAVLKVRDAMTQPRGIEHL